GAGGGGPAGGGGAEAVHAGGDEDGDDGVRRAGRGGGGGAGHAGDAGGGRRPALALQGVRAMTEAEWLACADPEAMLAEVRKSASDRKLRLFAAACCRRLWFDVPDLSRRAVTISEAFVDGQAG